MMKSPNKDLPLETEESSSSKKFVWNIEPDSDTNEPSSLSSFSVNESVLHENDEDPERTFDIAGNETLNDKGDKIQNSPCKKQTARKSFWRGTISNLDSSAELNTVIKSEPQLEDDAVNISAKVLHFFCQKCNNGIRYSPNDLQKHFHTLHNGESPVYPCEMCNFTANDFQLFKQHRKTHRSALVKCEICNNDYLYTLLALTKHFTVMHCVNGHFNCSKCKFSTRDVGTFVQHIHRHNGIEYACQKCNHISFSKIEFQKHLQGHSALFPFSCQYCSYSAMRKDFIVKHVLARHREHIHTKDELFQESCEQQMVQTPAGLKLVLKRYQTDSSNRSLWRKEAACGEMESEADDDQSATFQYKPMDKSQTVNDISVYNLDSAMQDGIASVTTIKCSKDDSSLTSNLNVLKNAVHGPTVLMVKNNKINVPANYSATFMGYKMVNGKQNLVIKLLPTGKQSGTNPDKPPPNNLPLQGQRPFDVRSNGFDSRQLPSFRPPASPCSTSVGTVQKLGVPYRARNEHSSPIRQGTAASQAFLESIRKDLVCRSIPNTFSTDHIGNVKEEPEEYSINEQQNMHLERNRSYEFSNSQVHPTRVSNSLNLNPNIQHLLRHRHSSDSGLAMSKNLFSKDHDIRNSMLHTLTASRSGGFNFPNANMMRKNDHVQTREKQSAFLGKSCRTDNISFMPRITSVFSLQNRAPAPTPFVKNTYLHNMLQENKKFYDRMCAAKTQNSQIGSSTLTSAKQSPNVASKFDTRLSADTHPKGNVANSASLYMQGPISSGSEIKSLHSNRVGDLLKAHSDAIVHQQLAKEKMLGVTRTGSSPAFRILKGPQNPSFPQPNNILLPPTSNKLLFPFLPNNPAGLKMNSSQPIPQSNIGINTSATPNTQSNMVLTLTNGPLGTIRNVTNSNSQAVVSPMIGSASCQGRLPFPRMPHPSGPFSNVKNVSTNVLPGSSANNVPVNLNLLQYRINSDSSVVRTGNLESVNKKPEPGQKQPVYALLPDGKQAVLLKYVLPKPNTSNLQKSPGNHQVQNNQPKKSELGRSNAVKVKIEDTSGENPISVENHHKGSIPGSLIEQTHCSLRPRPSFASIKDHLFGKLLLPPSPANASIQNKLKCKPSISNAWSAKNKSFKRKASDSSSYTTDTEIKNKIAKKKLGDEFQEPPRKKMLHRKYANQLVVYPQENQPVVVLNHPDADIPEVVNVMKTISKFNGQVLSVSLSKRTIEALLESKLNSTIENFTDVLTGRRNRRAKPLSPAKERFVLKLTLKKTSKNNYKIVKNTSENQHKSTFHCWFCGRIFDNQDEWVGHGQRHLMEATKDWNTLF
ncbi:hypothetical protein GDO86_013293 [Hymenochirus boettgeri]|uniref:C2H2-type domain-containing protein n=1 Tax=Hymenochirus boettgeri TaxID=247094 RepID=A0A8T2IW44_9PIPI|nr:hypothetical protein GDO86_013293 [Hymenochirus boettgeri]